MIQISSSDTKRVLDAIGQGTIDAADVSYPNLIDAIILKMKTEGILELLGQAFSDKRSDNASIPWHLILTLAVTAKMKIKCSLSDIPFAITDAGTLSEIGWNIWDNERTLEAGLMTEGALRNLVNHYDANEFIQGYNTLVQKHVFPQQQIEPDIHILDCTELEVPLDNARYEDSEVVKDKDGPRRGYKLGTIRGIYNDTGVIEDIRMGSIKQHDMALCKDMILSSPMLKPGDILINDRGFISRTVMNTLKTERKVDTYVPLKKNMEAYEQAVSIAKDQADWQAHPNKKRKTQTITLVTELGPYWKSAEPGEDVPINACVVYDSKQSAYMVFVTTDTQVSAKQILELYELRPEIEEDYRQLKDFWKLDKFTSTKIRFIEFHIVMVLIGYMYFQLFKGMKDGKKYAKKCLPVAVKNYNPEGPKSVIIYSGAYFAIFGFLEFIQLYASCDAEVKARLDPILARV